jgi:hypothetical protein
VEDVSDRNVFGDPQVRLMDGQTVVAVFACRHGQWLELGRSSKAEQRLIARRHAELKQLSGRARQECFAEYDREDEKRLFMRRPRYYVQFIGDEPFDSGGRRDRDGVRAEAKSSDDPLTWADFTVRRLRRGAQRRRLVGGRTAGSL